MLRLSTGLRTAMAGSTGFAAAFADGVIEIYSGAQPASADSAPTGTLLGIATQDGAAFTPGSTTNGLDFAAAADGAVSKTGNWVITPVAAGNAGWFRLKANAADAGGTSTTAKRLDGSIAVAGGDMALSNIAIALGVPATIDVFKFTIPAQ